MFKQAVADPRGGLGGLPPPGNFVPPSPGAQGRGGGGGV